MGAVDSRLALHTAARRYLIERRRTLIERYSELPNGGRAADGYHYTSEAKDTFPRYNVLNAILVEVERLDPDALPSHGELFDWLRTAGEAAEDMLTSGKHGRTEKKAMQDERTRFISKFTDMSIEPISEVEPLPYRRTLSPHESQRWHAAVEARWPIDEGGGWWAPFDVDNPPEETIALRSKSLDAGMGTDTPVRGTCALREALRSLGVDRVIELREYGPEYEVATDWLEPTYNGAEGLFTSGDADWLIFASHEGATAVGGTLVEPLEQLWPEIDDARWTGWDSD